MSRPRGPLCNKVFLGVSVDREILQLNCEKYDKNNL